MWTIFYQGVARLFPVDQYTKLKMVVASEEFLGLDLEK